MEIRMESLRLKNFKGVKEFLFEVDGENALVYGCNGSGKSTLADALSWLLFGKNQSGDASFSVKTLDESSEEIHNLEHEVEARFRLGSEDGSEVVRTFRKAMVEKWVKKRGSSSPEFSGHETSCFVDDVPKKQKEYQDEVAGLVREDLFRMLTSITHFSQKMSWQERRKLLLEVAGDVADADVIATSKEFDRVPEVLGGRSFEDAMKVLKAQRPTVAREIDEIVPRIDEVTRSKPSKDDVGMPSCGKSYMELQSELERLLHERAALLAGDTSDAKEQVLKLKERISKADVGYREALAVADRERGKLMADRDRVKADAERALADARRWEEEAKSLHPKIEAKRQEWYDWNGREEPDSACKACGQELPADQAEQIRARFLNTKAEKLKEINESGQMLGEQLAGHNKRAADRKQDASALTAKAQEIENAAKSVSVPETPDHSDILKLIAGIEEGIARKSTPYTGGIDEKIEQVRADIRQFDKAAEVSRKIIAAEKRVAELKGEQKRLGRELDRIDADVMLLEAFLKAKVGMLEASVAAKFSPLSFRLFETQINGGLREVCEPLVPSPEGAMVPYSDANTGHKILGGLRIIEVLSAHFGIHVPVIVDNAESLTEAIPEIGSQLVRLVASDKHKTLTVKMDASLKGVAA